jgi:hypothetical protein
MLGRALVSTCTRQRLRVSLRLLLLQLLQMLRLQVLSDAQVRDYMMMIWLDTSGANSRLSEHDATENHTLLEFNYIY